MLLLLLSAFLFQSNEVIIENLEKGTLVTRYIKLESDQRVRIKAVASRVNLSTNSESYFWILDAETRDVVWQLDQASYTSKDTKLIAYYDAPWLKKGVYELYFSTLPFRQKFFTSKYDILTVLKDRNYVNESDYKRMFAFLKFENGGEISEEIAKGFQFGENKEQVYSKNVRENYSIQKVAFKVKEDCNTTIYSLGELSPAESFDYAWLQNTKTHQNQWKMSFNTSFHAGGALKNRREVKTLLLKKGTYLLSYATDDTHSGANWNDAPPYDPNFYGVTILVDKKDKNKLELSEIDEIGLGKPFVKMTRLRNNAYKIDGLQVDEATDVRIYALGELGESKMLDYSWIVDVSTGRVLWAMSKTNTRPAGGNERNRIFDGTFHLPKGRYHIISVTNNEHSYNNWVEERPYDDKNWGLSLYKSKNAKISSFNVEASRNYLVRMTSFPNSMKDFTEFELSEEKELHIYAIGEADKSEMLDYGFIRNIDEDRIVWRMKANNTSPAGGSERNRLFDGTIVLPKGRYSVFFKTDRSHAFGNWKYDPPYNVNAYGISIFTIKK